MGDLIKLLADWETPTDWIGWATLILVVIVPIGASALFGLRFVNAFLDYRRLRKSEKLSKSVSLEGLAPSFSKQEIADAIRDYIEPDCAQTDPSDESDLSFVADIRAPIFDSVERFIKRGGARRFMFVLADSGMGKTTFCVNFYDRLVNRPFEKDIKCTLIALSRLPNARDIRRIPDQQSTVLLLDAFDEDPRAISDPGERITQLMEAAADFRAVIITCRSQFFTSETAVPVKTGVDLVEPRPAGRSGSYNFYKLYILPFSEKQIDRFINKQFPINSLGFISNRKKAHAKVRNITELAVRPMLLELVPDMIKDRVQIEELFDLYDYMIDKWLVRESKWIDRSELMDASKNLAVDIYTGKFGKNIDRVTYDQLMTVDGVAEYQKVWKHFTTRSLLNRDSSGKIKFAHRSILEYLVVVSALEGNSKCFSVRWTDFMRQLLVSWGWSHNDEASNRIAETILSKDLREASLTPLSHPLPVPGPVSARDLQRKFKRESDRSRRIPPQWRASSLRSITESGSTQVTDFEYDLVWQLPNLSRLDEIGIYRTSMGDLKSLMAGDYRLPSLDEFISLIDAEAALGLSDIIANDELYWIGDQLGRARYILASLSSIATLDSRLREISGNFTLSSSKVAVRLFELPLSALDAARSTPFVAVAPLVKSGGAQETWFRLEAQHRAHSTAR